MFRYSALIALLGTTAVAQFGLPNDTNLIGNWLRTLGEGTEVKDEGPKGHAASATDGVGGGWIKTGPFKAAYKFVNSRIDCGTGPTLPDMQARTYSAWIMPATSKSGQIINIGSANTSSVVFGLKDSSLLFCRMASETGGLWTSAKDSIRLGKWQFVAVTYIPGLRTPPTFYVDGLISPISLAQEPVGELKPEIGEVFSIGSDPDMTESFDGLISNVRVYSKALRANQIEQLADEPNYRLVFEE